MRASSIALAALLPLAIAVTGCASKKMERQVHDAQMRAASAEQQNAALDLRLRAMETSMMWQQSMLGRAMAKQDATDRNIAALGNGLPPAQPTAQNANTTTPPPPKELVDLSGQAVVVGADDATVREILTKVEAYMGRSLTATERQTLGGVLRRPRVIDTKNPWGPEVFNDR